MRDPLREGANLVARRLREHGFEAYFAGGCVRDLLLGKPPKDYDIATNAHPADVVRIFKVAHEVGAQFGVVLVRLPGRLEYEVATYRTDGPYADGRRPTEVAYSTRKEDDVARRDFTINALLLAPETGEVIDLVEGRRDLDARLIRAVGDANQRFAEDRLRMLRAVRFASTLGFEIEPETLRGVRAHASAISAVSRERIVAELESMWRGPAPGRAMDLLFETELVRSIFPFVSTERPELVTWFQRLASVRSSLETQSVYVVAWALLLDTHTEPEGALRELRVSRDIIRGVRSLLEARETLFLRKGSQADLVRPLISEQWPRDRAYLVARGGETVCAPWDSDFEAVTRNPLPSLPMVSGADLKDMGLSPSPRFKEILKTVEDAVLERRIKTREEALAYAHELAKL